MLEIVNLCRYFSSTSTCSCALQKNKGYFCKTLILKVLPSTSSSWTIEGTDRYHCKSILFRDDISEYVSLVERNGNANYHCLNGECKLSSLIAELTIMFGKAQGLSIGRYRDAHTGTHVCTHTLKELLGVFYSRIDC